MNEFPVYNINDSMSEYFDKLDKYLIKKNEIDYNNILKFINKWLTELNLKDELRIIEKFHFNEKIINNEKINEKVLFEYYHILNLDFKLILKNNKNEENYYFKLIIKILRKILNKIDYKMYSYNKNGNKIWFIKKNDRASDKKYNSDNDNNSEIDSDSDSN